MPAIIAMPASAAEVRRRNDEGRRNEAVLRYAGKRERVGSPIAGTNTPLVQRALAELLTSIVPKDTMSRVRRGSHAAWHAWCQRSGADEDVSGRFLMARLFITIDGAPDLERAPAPMRQEALAQRRICTRTAAMVFRVPPASGRVTLK